MRWIYNYVGTLIDGREVGEWDIVAEMYPIGNAEFLRENLHFLKIVAATSDGYEVYVVGKSGEGPKGNLEIFAAFDGADLQDVIVRKFVFASYFFEVNFTQRSLEGLIASLIDHVNFVGIYAIDFHYVFLSAFADGDNPRGISAGGSIFYVVKSPVDRLIAIGETTVYHVVNSDDGRDGGLANV